MSEAKSSRDNNKSSSNATRNSSDGTRHRKKTSGGAASASAPTMIYVVEVILCGSVGARGVYRPTSKKRNSQPIFKNGNGFELSREKLDTIGWIIGKKVGGVHCAHYAVASAAHQPPADGWKSFEGAEPPPTIVVKRKQSSVGGAGGGNSDGNRSRPKPTNGGAADGVNSSVSGAGVPATATRRPSGIGMSIKNGRSGVPTRDMEMSQQRNKLYERIIITETDYERYLSKILSYVVEPMRVARKAPKGFEGIVARFTEVLDSNSKILSYIHQRVETRPSQVISGVFIEHVGTLHSYLRYYQQYPEFLAAARKCLGDMRTLAADATFIGATLPVILFRPVQRMFEYEFFLRNLLHFTDRSHQFHGYFQKAHTYVLSALKELQEVMEKDDVNHVGDLMKVCSQLGMPTLILPGRRYNSTWALQKCCVGVAELFGEADIHVFTDMLCIAALASKPSTEEVAACRDMLRPDVILYHCDLTKVKLLPKSPGGPARDTGGVVSIHINDAYLKAPKVYNLYFAKRAEATEFAKAFEMLLKAPEVKFGLPAPTGHYPTAKFFIAPDPPAPDGTAAPSSGAKDRSDSSQGQSATHPSGSATNKKSGRRNWATHRKESGRSKDFKATIEKKKKSESSSATSTLSLSSASSGSDTPKMDVDSKTRTVTDSEDDSSLSVSLSGADNKVDKDCLYRLNVYRELVSTEQTYVANLRVLVSEFKHEFVKQSLVETSTLNKIFSTTEEILGVNARLAEQVRTAILPVAKPTGNSASASSNNTGASPIDHESEARSAKVILEAFSAMLPFLKIYGTYCNSYTQAIAAVDDACKSNEKLRKFLEKKQKQLRLNLESYLILPAQRFCKYPLFFRGILQHTPESHPWYEQVVKVESKIRERAQDVNDLVSNYQRRQRVAEIQQHMSGMDRLLKADRLYLADFKVQLWRADANKWKKITLFLFSDVLVVAKPDKTIFAKKGTLKSMNVIPWEELDLERRASVDGLEAPGTPAAAVTADSQQAEGDASEVLEFRATQAIFNGEIAATTVTNYKLKCKDGQQKADIEKRFFDLTKDRSERKATLKRDQLVGVEKRKWATGGQSRVTWRRGHAGSDAATDSADGTFSTGTLGRGGTLTSEDHKQRLAALKERYTLKRGSSAASAPLDANGADEDIP